MSRGAPPTRGRYRRTVGLALRCALQLWWLSKTRSLRPPARQAAKQRAVYTAQARRIREFATEMGGLIIKLGQFLSIRIDFLPKEYIDELSALQDAIPAVPTPIIAAQAERELGRPVTEVFASFDQQPIAAASLGQVHQARLVTGEDVAVKILRPGIEDLVETDLRSLRAIIRLAGRFTSFGRFTDLDAFYRDFEDTFRDELDYGKEGRNAETFQRNFLLSPYVDIPKIYWEHSSQRVLTMEYMDGVKINDLEALDRFGVDRPALARRFLELYLQMFLHDGFYHADPHPGNVLVRPDGLIQLIDFGMVGAIPEEMRRGFVTLIMAVLQRDPGRVVAAFQQLGFLAPGADVRRLRDHIMPLLDALTKDLGVLFQGTTFLEGMMQGDMMAEVKVDATTLAGIQDFIYSQPIQLPGNTTFLGKALITVVANCFKLDPKLDIIAVAEPFIQEETRPDVQELVTRLAKEGLDIARSLVPTLRHLISLAEALDTGSLDVGLREAQLRRLEQASRTEARRTRQTVAAATVLLTGILVLTLTTLPWLGITLTTAGGLALLWTTFRRH
ncbi:MAG: AarF/ABC1/UbiB kinase family protein [Propionibacteriaceae bacterium]|jgi:predicted unusual protein kinase regulating ubiquinone biosynthesis (AarF/ABC1/UbiB family)|nr:AarF/ABC1/UbiB kinase family protein [Propionibacteriaceae bacterium]